MKKTNIIVLSGGLDSTTLLYDLHNKGEKLIGISFDYGSKHNHKELPLAKWNCDNLNIPHKVIKIDLSEFKSSLLKNGEEIPEGHYAADNMKSTVVPFRNGIMLSYAVGLCESVGGNKVFLGSHKGDHDIYPDCRKSFTKSFKDAAKYGTYNEVEVIAPYENLMKWDIVKIGNELNIPYEKTWSCYKGQELPCGKCGTCVERIEAFEKNGLKDSLKY